MPSYLMKMSPTLLFSGILLALTALPAVAANVFEDENAGIAIHQNGALTPPASMSLRGMHYGEARVVIAVDATGRLTDSLAIGYTDPMFAEAALAAARTWTYEPARVQGEARAGRAELLFVFKADVVSVQSIDENYYKRVFTGLDEHYVFVAYPLSKLDKIPTPIHVVPPVIGPDRGGRRSVTVEFYIDEKGVARMPVVERKDAGDVLAAAAVAAVEQWRFEPPLRKGQPVLVLAKQEFTFKQKP